MSERLSVAFADTLHDQWTAGAHYYQNLFFALRSLRPETEVHISLLRAPGAPWSAYFEGKDLIDGLLTIPPDTPPHYPAFWQRQRIRVLKRARLYRPPPPPPPALETLLRTRNVHLLFTTWVHFGPAWTFPTLVWIPDFQHLHLPDLFTPAELEHRNSVFAHAALHATRILLSSETARRDFEQFLPSAAPKARVLPFVAQVPTDIYQADPSFVLAEYHLPERFIYLPNQFWQHKNHELVLQALQRVCARHPEITVVCTGNTNDTRAPLYFGKLLARIAGSGVRNQFLLLGWIPHAHMFQLMRQALAVLQPSLFEGWSTTVEEARSVGKTLLLSDLPIHREQDPPQAIYFDPHDPDALADALVRVYAECSPGPDLAAEARARADLPLRTREFGRRAVEIFHDTLSA